MSDFRVGSAPAKSFIHHAHSSSFDSYEDQVTNGFLNRKFIQDVEGKRSKDRAWQTFWCHLHGTILEYYRVEGVRAKPLGEPPPRDVYPPPNLVKYKTGFVELEDAIVELDYTSQLHKDTHKRRKYLIRVALPNQMLFLLQAPSDTQRMNWVIALQSAARRFEGDDSLFDKLIHQEMKIKAARCSLKNRSRQNVHSVKRGGIAIDEEDLETPVEQQISSGDPRLQILKKRLQNKKELLKQFNIMYGSFLGENICMYSELSLPRPMRNGGDRTSRVAVNRKIPVLSEAQINTDEVFHGDRCSTGGEMVVPIVQRLGSSGEVFDFSVGVQTELLMDYYVVPGAEWSVVKKGESMSVLGRLPNGWYRCAALREAECHLEPTTATTDPSHQSIISGLSEISSDSGLPLSEASMLLQGQSSQEAIPEEKAGEVEEEIFQDDDTFGEVNEQEACVPVVLRRKEFRARSSSIERPMSYQMATEEITLLFDELGIPPSEGTRDIPILQLSEPHNGPEISSVRASTVSAITFSSNSSRESQAHLSVRYPSLPLPPYPRLDDLIEQELHTQQYYIPLIGCVPPSALKRFADEVRSPSPSPAADRKEARPASGDHSPGHSHLSVGNGSIPHVVEISPSPPSEPEPFSGRQVRSASLPPTSLTLTSPLHKAQGNHVSNDSSAWELASPPPDAQVLSFSVPPRAIHSAESTPVKQPSAPRSSHSPHGLQKRSEEGLLSATTKSRGHPLAGTTKSFDPSTAMSHDSTPKSYESPAASLFDSGSHVSSLFRKLFTRRQKQFPKQFSLPDNERIAEGGDRSPSPRSPSPIPVPLFDDEFDDEGRTRVSSMSGRVVRARGVGLVIGEDSSSDSEDEDGSHSNRSSIASLPVSPTSSLHENTPLSTSPTNEQGSPPAEVMSAEDTVFSSGRDDSVSPAIPKSASDHALKLHTVMKRSASDHDSLKLQASLTSPEEEVKPLKRNTTLPAPFRLHSFRFKTRTQSEDVIKRPKTTKRKKRRSWTEAMAAEPPKVTGIFRQPPRGEKRYVYLDPQQPKFGFRLESYGRHSDRGKVLQTFVQSVAPGSPAFMAGLYPGDAIVEVNGVNVRYAPVEEVVGAITGMPRKSKDRIKLVVEFVDGVTRLERMKKADELKYQMQAKQAYLRELLAKQSQHLQPPTSLPSPKSIILAHSLPSWRDAIPIAHASLDQPSPITHHNQQPLPFDRHLNGLVSLYSGRVMTLGCGGLVIPLSSCHREEGKENALYQLIQSGGSEMMDELCLAKQCRLGDNITTQAHKLPMTKVYHCVFGDLEESLLSCCRLALEDAANEKLRTIAFWIDGFSAISVSPHIIIETVRLWLQEDQNGGKFERVVFLAKANVGLVEMFLKKFFPLQPSPERASDETPASPSGEETTVPPAEEKSGSENQDSSKSSQDDEVTVHHQDSPPALAGQTGSESSESTPAMTTQVDPFDFSNLMSPVYDHLEPLSDPHMPVETTPKHQLMIRAVGESPKDKWRAGALPISPNTAQITDMTGRPLTTDDVIPDSPRSEERRSETPGSCRRGSGYLLLNPERTESDV